MSESEPTVEAVRREAAAWIGAHWDPDRSLREWRSDLVDSGWGVPSWPERWFGRGLPAWADRIAADELQAAGAVGLPLGAGTSLAAPTVRTHGSEELCDLVLRPTLIGDVTWTQLFSEPGAGSDLAGLSTTAIRDGDDWVVNGQKVWNTSAHHADLAMLVARTDWDVPKHQGISYFVLPMRQPGVEARPIVQMNRHTSFNEVFLSDARIPASHLVGQPGDGWRIARTTLMHERTFATLRRPVLDHVTAGRAVREAAAEAEAHFAVYSWYPQRAGRADLLVDAARHAGSERDATVRQQVADVLAFRNANEWTAARARAARARGRPPGPEGSLGKLAASELARRAGRAHTRVAGATGMLAGDDSSGTARTPGVEHHATVAEVLVSTPAQSIAGGTDEIQHNIIGENVLGLPREPAVDRDVAFRDVRRT